MEITLTDSEKIILLITAREASSARHPGTRLRGRAADYGFITAGAGSGGLPEVFTMYCGAFVTLHSRGKLRGCIGNMTGVRPLLDTIKQMAEASAFEDPRFSPLSAKELPEADIEISVLSPLRLIRNMEEIEVGRHGLYIRREGASGVLLPQVAAEQGWDRDTFLTHVCYKAGLPGSCYREPETEIQIFTAEIFGEKEHKY